MLFSDILNKYIEEAGAQIKEISEISGISTSNISRYRNGKRLPDMTDDKIDLLAGALVAIADKNGKTIASREKIEEELFKAANSNKEIVDYGDFSKKLDSLIDALQISPKELAKWASLDVSYLSRIRTGARKPQNIKDIILKISEYVATNYKGVSDQRKVAELIYEHVYNRQKFTDTNEYTKKLLTGSAVNMIKTKKQMTV